MRGSDGTGQTSSLLETFGLGTRAVRMRAETVREGTNMMNQKLFEPNCGNRLCPKLVGGRVGDDKA